MTYGTDTDDYARRWSDMSFDFKAFFVAHGGIMVLFITGRALTIPVEIAVEAGLLAVIGGAIAFNKIRRGWRWAGAGPKQMVGAAVGLVFALIFIVATSGGFVPVNPGLIPWYFAVANIGLFNLLQALRLVRMSQAAFERDCSGSPKPAPEPPTEPGWRTLVSSVYRATFLAVWLASMGFFFLLERGLHDGAVAPSASATYVLVDHSKTVYLTAGEGALIDGLKLVMMIGIPTAIAAGFLLQYVVGVRVFPGVTNRNRFR